MSDYLDKLDSLRRYTKVVDATSYNRVRLALNRLGKPLRFPLREHRGMEVILDDQVWLCVDSTHGDLPILAWKDFQTGQRSALHEPVSCQLHLYHMHAGLVMGTILDAIDKYLKAQLKSYGSKH